MLNKYFIPKPTTCEDLKKMYKSLAMKHHPDRGGSTEAMKAVNAEYDYLFEILKNVRKNKDGETYTAWQETTETPEYFKDIIDELMKMDDIIIEIIGCFVWVTGNTRIYKEKLKELKFRWHSAKIAWYLKPDDYVKTTEKIYTMDEIRSMFGTKGQQASTGTEKLNEETA